MYHVYVLKSDVTGRYYTGSCENLDDQLAQHNAGESLATRHDIPWQLVHTEEFATRSEAIRRERFLKSRSGRNKVRRALEPGREQSEPFAVRLPQA